MCWISDKPCIYMHRYGANTRGYRCDFFQGRNGNHDRYARNHYGISHGSHGN